MIEPKKSKIRAILRQFPPKRVPLPDGKTYSESFGSEWVRLYQDLHMSLRAIARQYRVSAAHVAKTINRLGVDTSKAIGCWVDVTCTYCDTPFRVTRSRYRATFSKFCGQDCYTAWLRITGYRESTHGRRLGRGTVAHYYGELPPGSIVHHVDGNQYNNNPDNLMLFASSSDHVRWHRGLRHLITPLWSGRDANIT